MDLSTSIWRPLHSPMDETRLLMLGPATSREAGLIGSLQTVHLDDNPQYEAVSYCWGSDCTVTDSITISGEAYEITLNLSDVLRKLRRTDMTRVLWVDALCINQSQNTERAAQVAIMDIIYTRASCVLVWLDVRNFDGTSSSSQLDWQSILKASEDPTAHFTESPWAGVGFFHGWGKRMWTIQEAVLAADIHFHTHDGSFSLQQLKAFMHAVDHHFRTYPKCCRAVWQESGFDEVLVTGLNTVQDLLFRRLQVREMKFDLLELSISYPNRKATDPKDRLFSLTGIAKNVPPEFVTYETSLAETYTFCASAIIAHTRNLDVLDIVQPGVLLEKDRDLYSDVSLQRRGVRNPKGRIPDLPSWVADWSQRQPLPLSPGLREQYLLRRCHHASKASQTVPAMCSDKRSILLTGRLIDTVAVIGQAHGNPWLSPNRALRNWFQILASACGWQETNSLVKKDSAASMARVFEYIHRYSYYSNQPFPVFHETMLDAFRRILVGDRRLPHRAGEAAWAYEIGATSTLDKLVFMLTWTRKVCEDKEHSVLYGTPEERRELKDALETLGSRVAGLVDEMYDWISHLVDRKRFFVSAGGHIGIGSIEMEVGDVVAVLGEGRVPYVLRGLRSGDGDGERMGPDDYDFVGGAYVHGLMQGEGMDDRIRTREVVLR